MTRDDVIAAFDNIRVWQRGDQRAVHKPLLVLYALSKIGSTSPQMMDWNDIEPHLKELLEEFGPDGSSHNPHYPFWHLKTDGFWQLEGPPNIINRPPKVTPTLTELRSEHVRGGFSTELINAFHSEPGLVNVIAGRIVDAHFPESIRNDVLEKVGLSSESVEPTLDNKSVRRRDPAFRERVLLAYQYKCAICGHDLRLGRQTIGLEAAHIKWFQAQGPDIVPNGLALCSMHHKIFDLGAFTILPGGYQIVFSQHLNGGNEATARMLTYHGSSIILPQSKEYLPQPEFLAWHKKEVFKNPERE